MAFDWKGAIGKVAPWLAGALGGPAAGLAVSALCKATGLEPTLENAQKAAEMAAAGSLTGDQFIALKKAEQDFQLQMQEQGFKSLEALEEIGFKDRDSARNREIKTGDWTPRLLALGITVGFFGLLTFLLIKEPPTGSRDILNIMLGALGTAWISITGYYFGSSAGSARKTEIMGGK